MNKPSVSFLAEITSANPALMRAPKKAVRRGERPIGVMNNTERSVYAWVLEAIDRHNEMICKTHKNFGPYTKACEEWQPVVARGELNCQRAHMACWILDTMVRQRLCLADDLTILKIAGSTPHYEVKLAVRKDFQVVICPRWRPALHPYIIWPFSTAKLVKRRQSHG